MVPRTPLGPPGIPLGVQGETQELHLQLPKSIFKDIGSLVGSLGAYIGSLVGSLGAYIFSYFGVLFSTFFWSSLLKQFWINMFTIFDPFWKLF